jgi:putative ABC transport system permease protein
VRIVDRVWMVFEGVGIAFDAMRANKVRASLTIMGVAVGVFVVTAIGAAVHGIRESFRADVDAFGATSFQVRRRPINLSGCSGTDEECPDRRNPAITVSEATAIRDLAGVKAAVELWGGSASFRYRDRFLPTVGYDAMGKDWLEIDVGDIAPGRNFTAQESATDQCQSNGVVLRRVDMRKRNARKRRGSGKLTGGLKEIAS